MSINMSDCKSEIQLVDDTPENLDFLALMLTKAGYEVRIAINGEVALESIRFHRPDLILLDIMMPGLSGFEVCEQLKADELTRNIPVIFISAMSDTADKVKGLMLGGVDYITKPFQEEEVLTRVGTHLTLRKTQEELREKNGQLNTALQEKEVLMKEILHRTKNNMMMIRNLLSIQFADIEDERVLQMFKDTESRVKSMELVQKKLYQSKDFAKLDLKEYLHDLVHTIFSSFQVKLGKVSLRFDLESVIVPPDKAIPCGLILNELLTNALKYAFPGERTGEIRIALHTADDDRIELGFSDNGVGLPENLNPGKMDSLGMKLVIKFGEYQLGGTVEWKNENGAVWRIVF